MVQLGASLIGLNKTEPMHKLSRQLTWGKVSIKTASSSPNCQTHPHPQPHPNNKTKPNPQSPSITMHPITTLLSTLLLSTTLTSALPAAAPPPNIATQPQHSTTSNTDPISPPRTHVRRQKVAQPYALIAPDRKEGWKRTSEPELDLAARQVKWLPPNRNYLPVPDKAFKARDVDVDVDDDSGVERRQKVSQPRVLVAPDRKMGWKRSDERVEPAENDDNPGVVARQVKTLLPVRVSSDRNRFKARDVEAGEEVGDGNRKRDKGSYVSVGASIGAHKPWVSSGREQVYW